MADGRGLLTESFAATRASRPHPIKARMIEMGVTHEQLGLRVGKSPGLLSRYFRRVRPMPEGFAARCHEALDLIEEAEEAAEEARAKVLGEAE